MTACDTQGRADTWFTPRRFALVLALLIVAAFPEVTLGLKTFVHRDFGLFGYPLAFHHRESFWRGELPLWNPYNNGGLPFLAQWNTLVLYPGSLIYLLLPLPWSLNLFCLAHLFWAGLGMYWLAQRWTGHRLAAAIAGTAFAFNGLTLNALMWPNNIAALGWMPWVVWAVEEGWRKGGRSWLAGSAAGALQMLTGAPEIILFTWLLLAAAWTGQWWKQTQPRSMLLARAAAMVAMVAGLTAVQMFPFFDLLRHSHRDAGFSTGAWPMPPWGWVNFLVPLFHTYRSGSGLMYQPGQSWTSSYYVSIGVVALALWTLARLRQPRAFLLSMALLGSLVLALGDAGKIYRWLREGFPSANFMRFPIKFVVIAVFVLPILAAFAVREGAQDREDRPRKSGSSAFRVWLVFMLGLCAVLAWAFVWPLNATDWEMTWKSGATRALFLSLSLLTMGAALGGGRGLKPWLSAPAVVLLIWADVLTHAPWQNPTAAIPVLAPGAVTASGLEPAPALGQARALISLAALEELYAKNSPDPAENVTVRRVGLHNNLNLLARVPKVDGFFSLYLPEERAIYFRLYHSGNEVRTGLADFLGVSRLTSPSNSLAWTARPTAMPLLTAGQRPVFGDREHALTNLMARDFNPRTTVYLPSEAEASVLAGAECRARVTDVQWSAQRISATVEAEGAALAVISQAHFPAWKASVDGIPAPIWQANLAFQAVGIPAGKHRLTLEYQDSWFRAGAIVSGLSTLAWLLLRWRYREA